MSNDPGTRIGDYEILDELGRGGMGRVYRVRNVISDRVEAMKVLLPELAGRQELASRFLREIKLVASLDHPNIGALRTALMVDDQLVMVMEYVEGTTLEQRLKQGPLPTAEALDYAEQVLKALSYAHKRGVVHRDIKPANMMLTADGIIKVMDFGIAFSGTDQKLTSTGTTMGSLPYMSPEQVKGESADPRSDLYSLGVSLYEMVTGRRPFAADSDFAIMTAHIKEAPRPPIELQPGLPAGLNTVILKALSKEKEERFQSADQFLDALRGVAAAGETVVFTPSAGVPADVRKARTSYSQPGAGPAATTAATAVAQAPPPSSQPARQGGHRALYMSLGAVLALVLLIVVGTYYRSGAAGLSEQTPQTPPPVSEGAAEAMPAAPPAAEPAVEPPSRVEPAQAAPKAQPSQVAPVVPAPPSPEHAVAEASPGPDISAQLDELETQIDQLTSRALAVDSNLETLRGEQRAAGFDLRGDVVGKWESMKLNLAKAQESLANGDVVQGKKYADWAENYVGQLERFLGR